MSANPYRIIFMPGIRPKPPPQEHAAQLRRSLHAGMLRVGASAAEAESASNALSVVGWSHPFYKEHGDVKADMPGIERLLTGQDDEAHTLPEARSIARQTIAFCYAVFDRFPLLSSRFSTSAMQRRVGEIRRYFANTSGESTQARQLLAEQLRASWARKERVALVAHSFGSVIAYDTLWELTRSGCEDSVDMFVTLGSPLTMGTIRRRLLGTRLGKAERYPRNIRRWVNYAAVGEVTALERKLGVLFAPMVEQGLVESISDDLSLVNCFHGPDGLNVHKCYGYFASRLVSELLLDWHRSL
jgi:hypothetical protein